MKIDIKEALFWIFLIIAVTLLLWSVFGNSPTELITIISVLFMITLKIWSVSDKQIKSDLNVKNSFDEIKEDINEIKINMNSLNKNLELISKKINI